MLIEFLEVLEKVIGSQNIQMTVLHREESQISEFDLGIRHIFQHEEAKAHFINSIYRIAKEKKLYYIKDFFEVEYCLIPVPEKESYGDYLLLGPYQDDNKSELEVLNFTEKYYIAKQYKNELKEYYNAVPIIRNMNQWKDMCETWYRFLYQHPTKVESTYISMDSYGQVFGDAPFKDQLSSKMIEERYQREAELLKAISQGDTEDAMKKMNLLSRYKIHARYKDPIRELRNGLVIINTLFRKAAQSGSVPSAHIDTLSTQFAKKLETVNSIREYERMVTEMVRKYCMLVRNYSLKGYSPIIQNVVKYINLNLSEDLSLKRMGIENGVNGSYLSTLFKKEVGMNLTDYVVQQRVRRAILLLNSTNMQIQDIAAECGIYDVNYFRKIFKKSIGLTPTEYVKQIRTQPVIDETR